MLRTIQRLASALALSVLLFGQTQPVVAAAASDAPMPTAGAEAPERGPVFADGRFQLAQLVITGVGGGQGFHGGGGPVTFTGPWWDDGSATQGRTASQSLNANTFNGLTWVGNGGDTTNVAAIQTSASSTSAFGAFRGSQGTTPNHTFTYINTPSSNSKWVVRGLALSATTSFGSAPADFLAPATCCVSGSNLYSYVDVEQTSLGAGSLIPKFVLSSAASTSATTIGTAAPSAGQVNVIAGDNLLLHYYPCNGNTCQDINLDGQLVKVGGVVSGLGFTLTNFNFGWRGDMPNTPNKYNYLGACDPDTQACLSLVSSSHIVAVDSNGDLTPHFYGTYTQSSLGGLTYSLYDGTTGLVTAVAGVTATLDSTSGVPIPGTSFTGSVSGTTMTVTAMSDQGKFIHIGDVVSGTGITAGSYVTVLGTGLGGIGTYTLSASSAATGSITITSTPPTQAGTLYRAHGTKILKASIPASFYYEVCRTDITGGSPKSCARSSILSAGPAHAGMGQSIIQQAYATNLDYDVTFGTNKLYTIDGGWTDSGSAGAKSSAYDVRALPLNTSHSFNTPPRSVLYAYMAPWMTATSNTNMVFLTGGIGGTTAFQRAQAGSSAILGLEYAIDLAGGDLTDVLDSSGTFDTGASGSGSLLDYASSLDSFYSIIETYVGGHQIPVTLMVLGTTQGVAAGLRPNYDTLRRIQYNQSIAGGRYCLGLGLADEAHATSDQYHYSNQGWAEEMRRGELSKLNCALGGTTYKRGLYLNSATTPTTSTVAVVFDAPNAAGVQLNNTGNPTVGWDQGLNFGTITGGGVVTNALGTIHPTNTTCGSVSASQVTCTFTFGSALFATDKAMVTGPRGSNPFNSLNTTAIDDSGATNKDYWADGMAALMATYAPVASVGGSITGTVLTITSGTGTLKVGDWLMVTGTTRSILITSFGTGTGSGAGLNGTYNILQSATGLGTAFVDAEPMVPVQTYFKTGGLADGSQDFITTP